MAVHVPGQLSADTTLTADCPDVRDTPLSDFLSETADSGLVGLQLSILRSETATTIGYEPNSRVTGFVEGAVKFDFVISFSLFPNISPGHT